MITEKEGSQKQQMFGISVWWLKAGAHLHRCFQLFWLVLVLLFWESYQQESQEAVSRAQSVLRGALIGCVGGLWLCRGFKRFETNLLTGNLFQYLWTHQNNPAFIMSGTEGGDNDESVLTWNNLQTPSSCRYKHFLCSLSQFCLGELVLYLHSKLVIM